MRTLLLTVLVSFNLVACVTGDNDAMDQGDELSAIDGDENLDVMPGTAEKNTQATLQAETDVQGDLARAQQDERFEVQGDGRDVGAPVQPGYNVQGDLGQQDYKVQGDLGKPNLKVQGDRYDMDQAKLYNPAGIEEVDLIKILRGVR